MDFRKLLREEREKARQTNQSSGCDGAEKILSIRTKSEELTLKQKDSSAKEEGSNNKVKFNFNSFILDSCKIGTAESIYYVPNAIESVTELHLIESVAFSGSRRKNAWIQLKNRRLQSWGKNVTGEVQDDDTLPGWLQDIATALVDTSIFKDTDLPDHVLINEYCAGDGILHHTDGPSYRDVVAILSLGSPCLMTFKKKLESRSIGNGDMGDVFSVLLQPRSLLVFTDTVYSHFMHGIDCGMSDIVGASAPCWNMAQAAVSEGEEVDSLTVHHALISTTHKISASLLPYLIRTDLQGETNFLNSPQSR
jgi:alkylated DNA repair protein alkB homolog 6